MSLLQMSLSGAVFILMVVVFRAITLNRLPKATFPALWDVALLRLLLPVTFRSPLSVYSMVRKSVPALDTVENGIANLDVGVSPDQLGGMENEAAQIFLSNMPSVSVLSVIWGVGAAVTAGYFILSYLRCRREFQTALPVRNDFTSHWHRENPLWRTVDIRQLTGLSTPLTYGILRPVILMPKDMDWRNERQAQYMLFHEYAHIRRFDAVGKLIAAAALCVHWFNPLVWVLYFFFNRDMELSCDECVIRHFGGKHRKDYAMLLIRMEEQRSVSASFGNYFSKNATEERIKAIMKFRRKPILALAFAVIIVAVGAVAAFAMAPKTGNADFGAVLRGDEPFLYVSEGTPEEKNISDVPALFDPNDTYMKIWAFTVLDLDGDGKTEAVLSVYGAMGDMGGSLILHQMDDKFYGYKVDYRNLESLKADGTYSYSDPTGAVEGGIGSVADFTETGMTMDKITYGRGIYGEWDTFVVNHRSATEEEYWAASKEQAEKPDAAWYDFTDENIRLIF